MMRLGNDEERAISGKQEGEKKHKKKEKISMHHQDN